MKMVDILFESIERVIDNDNPDSLGVTMNSRDIDYFGYQDSMAPSDYLHLTLRSMNDLDKDSIQYIRNAIESGSTIGSPLLTIHIPSGWFEGGL